MSRANSAPSSLLDSGLESNLDAMAIVKGLANAESVAYAIIDADNRILTCNDLFLLRLKIPTGTIVTGKDIDDVLSALSFTEVSEDKYAAPRNVQVHIISERWNGQQPLIATSLNGKQIRANNWRLESGEMIVTLTDVTQHHRRRNLIEVAMKSAGAGFWSLDFTTGKYSYSDSVLERLTDIEVKKMQDHGLWSIIHRKDLANVTKTWEGVISGREPFEFTYRVVTEKDGVMWQKSVGQIDRGSDGNAVGATAFVWDITRDVEKQKELLSAREASKAKSEFLARMSHEIRTPLNAIIGMSDSLKDEPLTSDVMEVVEDIEQAAEGLHNLLSKTLDHAKLISNNMQVDLHPVNISGIIDTCYRLWRPQCSAKNIQFKAVIDPAAEGEHLLDSFRLQQCLNNLLSNAVKFTSEGQINLVVKKTNYKDKDSLVIAVSDSGIGMSKDQAGQIFEAFAQADNSISRQYGGTGLGMSITKQLSELMGGEIRVKSTLGKGSVFAIILPLVNSSEELKALTDKTAVKTPARGPQDKPAPEAIKADAKPADNAAPQAPKVLEMMAIAPPKVSDVRGEDSGEEKPFEGLSVLCVEDNPINQKVVRRLIGKRVSNLICANNGREALDILSTTHVDVVLMDIHMPVMDGIEATLEIRSSEEPWANVIIIALTADPEYQAQRICKNIGMNDTIAKPVKRADILNAFDRTMGALSNSHGVKIKLTA